MLNAVYRTAVAVTDEALLDAPGELARTEGAFVCPEGAACFAAVAQLRADGWLTGAEQVVVLNTVPARSIPKPSR